MKSVLNNYETEKNGRPIYFELPYIQIMTPGNQLSIIDTPAREEHKIRFPRHWAIFQNSQTSPDQIVGTPLESWPMITRSQAEELKGIKFFTVEQIAGASDEQIQRLGMNAPMMRQKAKAYLLQAENSALTQQQAGELLKREQEINDLKNMIGKLAGQIEEMRNPAVPVKVKRKYTKRKPEPEPEPDTE